MTAESREDRRRQAEEQAAMWLERLERTLQKDESKWLREWLKVRLHREVIVSRCRHWHGPEILSVLGEIFPVPPPPSPSKVGRRFVLGVFVAMSGLGLWTIIDAFGYRAEKIRSSRRAEESYQTSVGLPRKILLPDGSEMLLNTDSHALVSYGSKSRDITLLRGEATFHVVADSARSFRVHAAGRRFIVEERASRFNIRCLGKQEFELLMIEGQLEAVPRKGAEPLMPAQVRAGYASDARTFTALEGARLADEGHLASRLTPDEVANQLAWHGGQIILTDQTLENALAEIERYTPMRFVFSNDGVRQRRLTAEVRIGDIDGVVRLLQDTLQIEARQQAHNRLLLSSPDQD